MTTIRQHKGSALPATKKRSRARSLVTLPHVRASRRLIDQAVKDANRARWAYMQHAAGLQTALDKWRHAVEDMQRAALSIADLVYAERQEVDHVA